VSQTEPGNRDASSLDKWVLGGAVATALALIAASLAAASPDAYFGALGGLAVLLAGYFILVRR
jgi:hypothetical protein